MTYFYEKIIMSFLFSYKHEIEMERELPMLFAAGFHTTLGCVYLDTPRVFSTKTQHFSPMFLKSVVEVHLFLKGSK